MIDEQTVADLINLGHMVGSSRADLAIAGEGNLSGPGVRGTRIVTASGARLDVLDSEMLVEVRIESLSKSIDQELPDEDWLSLILGSRVNPEGPRPTVEVALHAVIAALMGPVWIVHAHPVDVLAIACSADVAGFAETRLFPDQVVALGRSDLWLPYVDPGRALATAVQDAMIAYERRVGSFPVSIILANHGAFTVGATPREAFDRMLMLAKAARIFNRGGRQGLPPEEIERIHGREDEAYRRSVLRAKDATALP